MMGIQVDSPIGNHLGSPMDPPVQISSIQAALWPSTNGDSLCLDLDPIRAQAQNPQRNRVYHRGRKGYTNPCPLRSLAPFPWGLLHQILASLTPPSFLWICSSPHSTTSASCRTRPHSRKDLAVKIAGKDIVCLSYEAPDHCDVSQPKLLLEVGIHPTAQNQRHPLLGKTVSHPGRMADLHRQDPSVNLLLALELNYQKVPRVSKSWRDPASIKCYGHLHRSVPFDAAFYPNTC